MPPTNHQWRLAQRPEGLFKPEDFTWTEEAVPELADGQVLVRVLYLSLDPTQRMWAQTDSYLPAVKIGATMRSGGLGVVEVSKNPAFAEGDIVSGMTGWQEYLLSDGKGLQTLPRTGVPLTAYLGPLGMTGITAYYGLLDIGKPQAGETLVVSGAAGAVGSVVCQIGKLKGLRVVGVAGSDEKCAYLTGELGADAAINYKTENVYKSLRQACPDGIDIYFENVGGALLDAVLPQLNIGARIPLCGYISQYAATEAGPGIHNLAVLISKRAKIEGFLVLDYYDRAHEAVQELAGWLQEGKLQYQTTVEEGLENAPTVINKLFTGDKVGKLMVKVSEDSGH